MSEWQQMFPKILMSMGIIALLVSASGLPHFGMSMTMGMDENGNMSMDCYMPGMTAVCNMTPLEHVSSWQSMFTSIPTQSTALMLLLAMFAIVGVIWTRHTHSPPQSQQIFSRFSHRRGYIPLHSALQELFSNGILNPKTF